MPVTKSVKQSESEIITLGLLADIGVINMVTGAIRDELNAGPTYPVSDLIIGYVNGYCGYLNPRVIKKVLVDDVKYFSRTVNCVNLKLSIDRVNDVNNNIFYHYRYKMKAYLGSKNAGSLCMSMDDFWNYFIRHDLDELEFLIDNLELDYVFLTSQYTEDNVDQYVYRAIMEIRDNIIGDCIDPWAPLVR